MTEITLWDAWIAWTDGQLLADAQLWGVRLLWWGRFGKIAQLLGGFTIIAEIIGPNRLRVYGSSLHNVISIRQSLGFILDTVGWA